MKSFPLVTVSLCALLLALGLGWWLGGRPGISPDGDAGRGTDAPALEPAAGDSSGEGAPEGEESLQAVDVDDQRFRADQADDGGLAAPRAISGRVLFPEDCAADPEMILSVLEIPCQYKDFARAVDHDGEEWGELDVDRELRDTLLHSVLIETHVASDGTFRIEAPPTLSRAFLMLRGRYLYLPRTLAVELSGPETTVLLAPLAGSRVRGRVDVMVDLDGDLDVDANGTQTALDGIAQLFSASAGGPMGVVTQPDSFSSRMLMSRGRFEFHAVPAGEPYSWTVTTDIAGGARRELGVFEAGIDIDVNLTLLPGGLVTGVVVDADGHTVADAQVTGWLPGRTLGVDDLALRHTRTDPEGRFTLANLPLGRIKVNADHPDFLDSPKVETEIAGNGSPQTLDLVLTEGRSITGRLELPDGSPATDVEVRASFDVTRISGPNFMDMTRGARSVARTDSAGNFRLRGLGKGPFVLEALSERELFDGGPVVAWRARDEGVFPGTEDLALVLRPPLGIAGKVQDEQGVPLTSFAVTARRVTQGEFVTLSTAYVRGDFEAQDGSFFLQGLTEGRWVLEAAGTGLLSPAPLAVNLPEPVGADPLVLFAVRSVTVSGRVLDSEGEGLSGARVRLDAGGTGWQMEMNPFPDEPFARSGDSGEFQLTGLRPGSFALVASARDHAPSLPLAFTLEPGQVVDDAVLRLGLGGTLEGEVFDKAGEPGSNWIVMIFSAADFSQVLGNTDSAGEFRLEHLLPGEWMVFAMDPSGELEVGEDGVDMASMMGAFQMSQATLREGETTHVTIGAPPENPVRVHGRVTLGGEPYTGVTLSFYAEGKRLYENAENTAVDGQGRYEVVLDGAGRYMISVQALMSGAGQQNTLEFSEEIPSQDEYRLNFEMPRGRISGRVQGPNGGAAAGARITLTPDGALRSDAFFGGQYTEITTDGGGTFDIKGLRAGRYRLSAGGSSPYSGALQVPYGRVTTGDMQVAENQWIQDVVLRLPGPGTIEVHVLDAAGHPLPQATIFVRDPSGRMLEPFAGIITDGTGSADYEGLAPGEYGVSARVGGLTCDETERVRVREGATTAVTLRLEEGTVLTVKLKDAAGDPAVGTVSVTDSEGREMTGLFGMQDMQVLFLEGAFSPTEQRLGPLSPGKYRVTATVNGKTVDKPVRLRGEPTKSLTLRVR